MTSMHDMQDADDDDGTNAILGDGWGVRDLICRQLDNPEANFLPGADGLDTIIAMAAAFAPTLARSRRYRGWINELRYEQACDDYYLERMPSGDGFQRRRSMWSE